VTVIDLNAQRRRLRPGQAERERGLAHVRHLRSLLNPGPAEDLRTTDRLHTRMREVHATEAG
jgi:hypothetical protein